MSNLPLGYRFRPTDHQNITILHSKIAGKQLPVISDIVFDCDVFDKTPPWELFGAVNSAATVGYFFTPLKRKSSTGSYVKRVVENGKVEIGTWKGETKADPIYDPDTKVVIGGKRYFTFCQDKSSGKRKRSDQEDDGLKWTMTEFVLPDAKPDFSLCRIKKKLRKKQEVQEEVLLQYQSNSNFEISDQDPSSLISQVNSYHPPPQFENNNSICMPALMASSSSWQLIDDYPPPLDYTTPEVLNADGYSMSMINDEFGNFGVRSSVNSYPLQFENNSIGITTPSVLNASQPQFEDGYSMSMINDEFGNFDVSSSVNSYPLQFENNSQQDNAAGFIPSLNMEEYFDNFLLDSITF